MKKLAFSLLFFLTVVTLNFAQSKFEKDRNAIKGMCGCYEVTFNFAETFVHTKDSTYQGSANKLSRGLEWVQLTEDSQDKIVMQHLLIVGSPQKQRIIKHWRQDWLYENQDLYTYHKDNEWTYNKLDADEVKGQWTQKVFQVDDSPRYEGSASWVHVDGKSYWENTTDAPLPRREYTKRNDYNVTVRGNRHEITPEGWIHDQDNLKVVRSDGQEDVVLAEEKGLNTYKKVADDKCALAQTWWKDNATKWALVRAQWDAVFAKKESLKLNSKVDDQPLYKYLFDEEKADTSTEIKAIIEAFVAK